MTKYNNSKINKSKVFFSLLMLALVLVVISVWLRPSPQDLTLRFHPFVGNKPLVLNTQSYKNPGGNGEFSIRDFQLFISNIRLSFPAKSLTEQESYHLVRFDGNKAFDQIVIPKIEISNLKKLTFGVGIDPKANGSLMFSGDLDPNSRMAWNWQVGYKFLLLEGTLTIDNSQLPLVYHIGFDESYTELNFDIPNKIMTTKGVINFKVDLLRLFQKPHPASKELIKIESPISVEYIDMSEMPHVKFYPKDVKALAEGFHDFISLM